MIRPIPAAGRWIRGGVARSALATACFPLITVVLGWPILCGRAALGPASMLDFDPLYGSLRSLSAPLPTMGDPTPIALDWPRELAIARGVQQGRLDLWNPLAACGTPLWAELGGPFFPLKLPFYLFPSRITYEACLLLRLAFAGLGAYLLGRQRGLTMVGAIAAGVGFELSGFLIYQVPFAVYSNTFVLPWVLLGAKILARRRSATAAVGTAVLIGLAASAGHGGIALLLVGAFVVAILAHGAALRESPRTARSCLLWGGIALVLGLALAAPALLPTAELLSLATSYKGERIGESVRSGMLSSWRVLLPISLFLPGFSDPLAALGVLPLAAASIGLLAGGLDAPLIGVGLLGLLLGATPIGFGWVNDLPLVSMILPIYALPLIALPLTQAVGRGVEVLAVLPPRRLGAAIAVPILACLALWLVCAPNILRAVLPALLPSARIWLAPAVTAVLAGAAVALRRTRLASVLGAAVTAAMICERVVVVAPQLHQPTSTVLASPPSAAVRLLQQRTADGASRLVGVPHRVGYPVTPMLFGLADIRGFAALPPRRYVEYLRAADVTAPPLDPAPLSLDMAPLMVVQHVRVTRSPLLDLAAVRWVVVPRRGPEPPASVLDADPALRLVLDDGPALVYENDAALPRVRFVHEAVRVPDEEAARAWALRTGALAGHAGDLRLADTVVVEPDEQGRYPVLEPPAPSAHEEVRIADQSDPDRLVIAARLDSPGLVVIADGFVPGWRARVDGVPAPIHPANLMFRAVPVPAGVHTLELEYRPRGFTAGAVLCALAALACVLLLLASAVGVRSRAGGHVQRPPG
jgi:hypothetical protein